MANLPSTTTQSSDLEANERFLDALSDAIAVGKSPGEIARRMAPNDRVKQKAIRNRVRNMLYRDAGLANRLAERARAEFLMALVPSARALGARAARGRPDAAKLLFEASGFHNPKVQHQHSGEINVKLSIPRPERPAIDVADAEVVD